MLSDERFIEMAARLHDAPHLILTRHKDEAIVIAGPAVIRVIDVRGGKVQLGVRADKSTGILREELLEKREPAK